MPQRLSQPVADDMCLAEREMMRDHFSIHIRTAASLWGEETVDRAGRKT